MTKLLLALAIMAAVWWVLKPKPKVLPDEAKARDILGVSATASAEEVRAAHRRLLGGVHPDRGGSAELTRQINAARDVLLRRLGA
ncbi:DnaJ domain-containing protein [Sphingomonas donggukensis]|uniref:DnaJ domain-containing protein n=1 Tax=Sphingomonas donggukensis TaxID=2949093 RepID=A0ABY4TXA2_9SPHN|nr:DnaJ domain-containing protein [Sphingomonas donggukensis]URW74938.1 DnaJ domain-containing protein [Sphingomonas donggukensis]